MNKSHVDYFFNCFIDKEFHANIHKEWKNEQQDEYFLKLSL